MLAHVAGEDLGAAHEAAGVEHHPQGEQWAIGAFVLGVSAPRLGLPARLAFEEGIGDIVESKGTLQFDRLIARPVRKRVL